MHSRHIAITDHPSSSPNTSLNPYRTNTLTQHSITHSSQPPTMDLLSGLRKGDTSRGGRAEFSWDAVKDDKDRENYLGHSLMAPVGRWQRNKDLTWYSKAGAGTAEDERREEIRRIKEAEQDALSEALGFPVEPRMRDVVDQAEVARAIKEARGDDDTAEERGVGFGRRGAVPDVDAPPAGDATFKPTARDEKRARRDEDHGKREHKDRSRRHRSRSRSRERRHRHRSGSRRREHRHRDERDADRPRHRDDRDADRHRHRDDRRDRGADHKDIDRRDRDADRRDRKEDRPSHHRHEDRRSRSRSVRRDRERDSHRR